MTAECPITAWPKGLSTLLMLCLAILGQASIGQAQTGSCPDSGSCPDNDGAPAFAKTLLAVKAETARSATEVVDVPMDMTEGANLSRNSSLENIIMDNLEHDLGEAKSFPDLDNVTNDTQGRHGLGQLGANLEFMMLKLAQLETIVELQQVEINELRGCSCVKKNVTKASTVEMRAKEESKARQAQEVLRKVLHKHNHQREKREFVTPSSKATAPAAAATPSAPVSKTGGHVRDVGEALIQRHKHRTQKANSNDDSLDDAVTAKWADPIVDVAEDVGGSVGDALGDAYEAAADQVSFVANTVIDSVEMAVDILVRGFTDWNAGCDESSWPSMRIDARGLNVNWGRQKCWVRLMGQTCNLFDFNFGVTDLNWPEPIKTVAEFGISAVKALFTMGKELVSCATIDSPLQVLTCFGNKIIENVPPLNFLSRISDVLTEKVLEEGQSLVQAAATSTDFPSAGAPPKLQHSGKNLVIQIHSQGADPGPKEVINFKVSAIDANYRTKLITQFDGKEVDTSSCLAFAPKPLDWNKTGTKNQATKADWQVTSEDDFIQLEPWAVPCSNLWMQKNWNKWQGYTFYSLLAEVAMRGFGSSPPAPESASIKQVGAALASFLNAHYQAFVGGLQFDLMPAPLAALDSQVVGIEELGPVGSGGMLLFSRTLRLTKRFGNGTDFVNGNIFGTHETYRGQFGVARNAAENGRGLEPISRTAASLAQAGPKETKEPVGTLRRDLYENSHLSNGNTKPGSRGSTLLYPPILLHETRSSDSEEDAHHSMQWATDTEDLYMASIEYGEDMGITKNSELRGKEVLQHIGLSAMQGEAKATKANYYQLFSFKNPGIVSFDIQGLLEEWPGRERDNDLDLGVKIQFGPFGTPTKRIRLVNVVEQFQIVLAAMPFVSESKRKALDALRDFGKKDVSSVVSKVPPPGLAPGSTIALKGDLRFAMAETAESADPGDHVGREAFLVASLCSWMESEEWTWERFTVVDAGNGEIALHNTFHNRFVRMNQEGMDASDLKAAADLLPEWSWERFTVVYGGNGTIALHSFVAVSDQGVAFSSITKDASDLPAAMIFERFRVLQDQMPWGWSWERFTVVDAGNGQIALHREGSSRKVRMNHADMDASMHKAASDLPKEWTWETFAASNGEIALHSTYFNRFVRMTDLVVDSSDPVNQQDYPAAATDWKFKIVKLQDAPTQANDDPWSFEVPAHQPLWPDWNATKKDALLSRLFKVTPKEFVEIHLLPGSSRMPDIFEYAPHKGSDDSNMSLPLCRESCENFYKSCKYQVNGAVEMGAGDFNIAEDGLFNSGAPGNDKLEDLEGEQDNITCENALGTGEEEVVGSSQHGIMEDVN
ncbi:hypothetical protein AK812_SmicGene3906 [Symbiodinium microadriaticum]|uniref:Uncharacterized protein n=1 Tax=Symbiodinium microadriaticum TaxID=2951 RepID=A0A1Q9EXY3_SYMMI|nr:hypothetical protein AK812_SmicGene3906 [Symbiodinium microadriaticum]